MKTNMKKSTTMFLQVVIALVGVAALAFLIWEPRVEGVNVNATNFEIYFKDWFLVYVYIASIPFFVTLYQAWKVLGFARNDEVFSEKALKALHTMKYCGILMIGFVFLGEIFILSSSNGGEDRPPAVFMGLLVILVSGTLSLLAKKFERKLQNNMGIEIKKNPIV